MGIICVINPEAVTESERNTFSVRHAARAVVMDGDGRIALLHVTNHHFHKLPGGGVEPGEDIIESLRRECREEIGCDILVGTGLGDVHEFRREFLQHQISYCFTAQVLGDKGTPTFMPDEAEAGFVIEWYYPHDALLVLESETPHQYAGKFIIERDKAIITAALRVPR